MRLVVLTATIFSSDTRSPGNQSSVRLPAFKYLSLFLCYCPSLSNLEIIFHNWPPTTYCLSVTLLTLCLPDWLVYYVSHSPDDLRIAWYLSRACFPSVIFILGVLQCPPAAILSPRSLSSACLSCKCLVQKKGEEIFCKNKIKKNKKSYLLWVHTHAG